MLVASCTQDSTPKQVTAVSDSTRTRDTTSSAAPTPPASGPSAVNTSAGYDSLSSHWSHIRVQISDYRIQYQSDPTERATEYKWTAGHVDFVTLDAGDPRSIAQYRLYNPKESIIRYALNWTVIQPGQEAENNSTTYNDHMQAWYAAHPQYSLENAFLHDASECPAGTPKTPSCRLSFKIWTQNRWAINPSDPGLRAYQASRLSEVAADADGLFLDEHASGDMQDAIGSKSITEYPNWSQYQSDMVGLLSFLHTALGPSKRIVINTSSYTSAWDGQMTTAAGNGHSEGLNDPFRADMEQRWTYLEQMLAAGNGMDLVGGGDMPANYTAGNSSDAASRQQLFKLASYYLVQPSTVDLLHFSFVNQWDQPFSTRWLKSIEVDVGQPIGPRNIAGEGTDPSGHSYRIWARDFQNAIVLVRPLIDWSQTTYDDGTAMTITLPPGDEYLPLNSDGTVGAPTDRVTLRASEAAIVLRKSRTNTTAPTP